MKTACSLRSFILIAVVALTGIGGQSSSASAAVIGPDPEFGDNGRVVFSDHTNPFRRDYYQLDSLALTQPGSGPTVVDSAGSVLRMRRDGSIVKGYGIPDNSPGSLAGWGADLAFDSQGRGIGVSNYYFGHTHESWMWRLNSKGQMDPTFGKKGEIVISKGGWDGRDHEEQTVIAVDDKDRYIIGGRSLYGREITVRRYWPNGTLDKSFSKDGLWAGSPGWKSTGGKIGDLQLVGDKIYVVGDATMRSVVFRLDDHGNLDRSFGRRGFVFGTCGRQKCATNVTCIQGCGSSNLTFLRDGTFVVTSVVEQTSGFENQIYRYRRNGSRVRRFGNDGYMVLDLKAARSINRNVKGLGGLFSESSGVAPMSGTDFVVGVGADMGEDGYRQIGLLIDGKGRLHKAGPKGLAFSLPSPDGDWGVFSAGRNRFYVTGREGKEGEIARYDALALYRFSVQN